MTIFRSRLGLALSLSYLGLFILSVLFAFYILIFHTKDSAFCALPAMVLTIPWSFLAVIAGKLTGYIEWYDRFGGQPLLYGALAMLPLFVCALINAGLIYYVSGRIAGRKKRP